MPMTHPIVIAVAPNGARKTKQDHPALPMVPQELAEEARNCLEAGATVLHLHVRDKEGKHTLSVEAYRAAISAIRKDVGERIIVQATSEACGIYSPAEQMAMVRELKPEAVSLAIKEIIPDAASETAAAHFLQWMDKERIAPQYILYSAEEVERFAALARRGIIPGDRYCVLFVLGRYTAGQTSSPRDLVPFLSALERTAMQEKVYWAVCAFGAQEAACMLSAGLMGGHARIGFENNMQLMNGTLAPDNAALIEQYVRLIPVTARRIATVEEARSVYGAEEKRMRLAG